MARRKIGNSHTTICVTWEDKEMFRKFAQFVKSCDLQMLSKIRSVLLIEQFMGEVVLRSRLCEFALYNGAVTGDPMNLASLPRCAECNAFFNETNALDDDFGTDFSQDNVFQRVYNETSVSDLETMAIFQQMYEQSHQVALAPSKMGGGGGKRKKKKLKHNNNAKQVHKVKAEPTVKAQQTDHVTNIKTEPEDASYAIDPPTTQLGDHFMAGPGAGSHVQDAQRIVKAEKEGVGGGGVESQIVSEENGGMLSTFNPMMEDSADAEEDSDAFEPDADDGSDYSPSKKTKYEDDIDDTTQNMTRKQLKDAEKERKKMIRNQRNEEKEKRRMERKQQRKDERAALCVGCGIISNTMWTGWPAIMQILQ